MIEIPGYRVLRQLGRAGVATVYLAVQKSDAREVALKVISPASLADPKSSEVFLRHAQIAARLHHRHIVDIHDFGRTREHRFIAMEYLSGGPVLARDGSVRAPAFALRVTREIASALSYAREKGFVHCGINPDSILLRGDESAVLTDVGITRMLDGAPVDTDAEAVVGASHDMNFEQTRSTPIDDHADLHCLGMVLYEMLVGYEPNHAGASLAIESMHTTQPIPILPARLRALQPLLNRLLATRPEERFQSGNDVAYAISEIESQMMDGALPELVLAPMRTRRDPLSVDTLSGSSATTVPALLGAMGSPAPRGNERSEPNLGRLDEMVAVLDDEVMRADRATPATRDSRKRGSYRKVVVFALLVLLAVGVFAAWKNQDPLRRLLPRTEFNDTLSRAQRALDAGRLTGTQGDSARELFLAARAQDPDNDVARRGIDKVGHALLERAQQALARNDLADARQSVDAARELLGGGLEVDRMDQQLRQGETRESETGQLLAQADSALAAGRVLGEAGAAALYQRALDGDKDNSLARAGLRKSAAALAAQARDALATKDPAKAAALADDITRIAPKYPGLPELHGRVAQGRDAARVAFDATLDQAEARVRAGDLAGSGDSALGLFRSVLQHDPANARAKEGLRRVAQAFVVQANAAIDDSNAEVADKLLASAAELAPHSPDLQAARADLRELRERLDIGAQRAVITPAENAHVHRLIDEAQAAVAAGHLIVPPGDSAYDKYRAALAINGNSTEALDGLARLPARAKELFAQTMADGAPQRARALLDAVRQVAPDDPAVPLLTRRLANAFLDQADARIGEGRPADAVRALKAARELSPDDPRIAPLEIRLQTMVEGRR